MKNNFNVLALVVALVVATPFVSQATEMPVGQTPPTTFSANAFRAINPTKVRLMVQKNTACTVWIEVKNEAGTVLFDQVMGKKETNKAFSLDLSTLPDGSYTVEVSSKTEKYTKTFDLSTPDRTLVLK